MEGAGKISALICARAAAREELVACLNRDSHLVVVGLVDDVSDAAVAADLLSPTLVLIEVPDPAADAFWAATASLARNGRCSPFVVLASAYAVDAHRAFEARALDFLLKPVSGGRVAETIAVVRARLAERRAYELGLQIASLLRSELTAGMPQNGHVAELTANIPSEPTPPGRYVEYFMARLGGKVTLLRVEDVDWIEADGYYAKLHAGEKSHLLRETLGQLEARLDPRQFVRVHRSAIVRIDRVHTLHPYCRGSHMLTLKDGTCITLSRGRRAAFHAALGGRM